ncbi:MAG TPA: universal stress protein [Pseudonocardiaceae bacterium]|nr:universal stress protein [Pseudonocardiaceae bacterium]
MDTQRRDRIVVGVDEGTQSALAVEWAAREAEAAGLPLALVHCETDRYAAAVIDPGIVPAMELSVRQVDAQQLVDDTVAAVQRIAPSVDIITHIEPGSPVGVLCRQAESAAMVVLGSEGSGLFAELVFGSVCGSLAVRSRCPVVAVREHPTPIAEDAPVSVGVDGTEISTAALGFAFRFADRHHVGVRAVHVLPHSVGNDPAEQEKLRWRAAESLAVFAERYPHTPIEVAYPLGDAVQVLARNAGTSRLLVVGSRGHGVAAGLLSGSVSQALLRSVRGPIAVVRKESTGRKERG